MTTQEPIGWNTLVIDPDGRTEGPIFTSWMSGRPYGPQERFQREGGLGAPNLTQTVKNDEVTGRAQPAVLFPRPAVRTRQPRRINDDGQDDPRARPRHLGGHGMNRPQPSNGEAPSEERRKAQKHGDDEHE